MSKKLQIVKKSDIILLKVYSTDYDACSDCNLAVIHLTKEVKQAVRELKSIIDIVKGGGHEESQRASLYKMSFWSPVWAAKFLCDVDVQNLDANVFDKAYHKTQNGERIYINREIEDECDDLRVETQLMHLMEDGIRFDCLVKHTDVKLETSIIPFKEFGL